MKKILFIQNLVDGYVIRTESLEGRDYWVVPLVMMVEGVHSGSQGAILYTAEELGITQQAWNGSPVVILHPDDNGHAISANDPDLVKDIVGRIFNTVMDGLKLRAEAWLDIEHLQEVSPETAQQIQEQNALDVSIGVFMEEEIIEGEFNNQEYTAIAHHMQADHLALLPNEVGACSFDDGCGVRTNKHKKGGNEMKDLTKPSIEQMLVLGHVINSLTLNETGFREIMSNVQQKLDQLDNNIRMHFLEELFEDHFVYRVHNRETGESQFFKRDYEVQQDGSVEFEGDPVEVRKEVSFEALKLKRTKFNNKNKKRMKRNNKPCKVDELIANKATQFTEDYREWLDALEEDQLDSLVPVEIEPETVAVSSKSEDEPDKGKTEDKEELAASSKKDIKKSQEEFATNVKEVLKKDPEAFINDYMPGEIKNSIKSGLAMYKEKREGLIEGIVANSTFKEANLLKWDDDDLQNLYDSVMPEADFSVLGTSRTIVKNEEYAEEAESMLVLNVSPKKKEDK